jgi:lipopolysaccharide export system protein LptA
MRRSFGLIATTALIISVFSSPVVAQQVKLPFGGMTHDTKQAVEIVADSFTISQNRGSAEFVGNVVVGQGDLRLSAGKIEVEYAVEDGLATGRIGQMVASEGVTVVSGTEAAEAQRATYSIDQGKILLEGNVLLTQGENALSGQKIVIDLRDGSAQVLGRVKTIFNAGPSE